MTEKQSLFHNLSIQNRKLLFYGICIWVRALIIFGVWKLWPIQNFRIAMILILLFTISRLYQTLNQDVWWSKRFHLFTTIILLVLFIASFYYDSNNNLLRKLTVIVMSIDLLSGIVNSFLNFA